MNVLQETGIKDLEHVVLKARDHITLGDRNYVPGEPILYFENETSGKRNQCTRMA